MASSAGLSRHEIAWRRGNEWQTLRRGIYAYAGVMPSPTMRAAAAVLAAGGSLRAAEGPRPPVTAVAAGRSAARVWGIPLVDDEDPATGRHEAREDDVLRSSGRSIAAGLFTRRARVQAADVVWVDGVPVLSPLRTAVDLAVVLRPDALVAALDHLLHAELLDLAELSARAAGDRRGQAGAVPLREALALVDPKAESPHESLTRLVLKPVLPGLESQVRVTDGAGRIVARLDLGDRELRLGVESDGAAYHRGRASEDRRRDRRTGWTIERCSWYETRCQPEQLRRRVVAVAEELRGRRQTSVAS